MNFLKTTVCLKYFVSDRRLLSFCVFVFYVCFMLWIWCHFKRIKAAITRSYIKQFVWYNLYDSQSAFSFSLRLHFDPSCSHRHFNPHALLELHKQLCFFSKPSCLLRWNEWFQRMYFFLKIQHCISPWRRLSSDSP